MEKERNNCINWFILILFRLSKKSAYKDLLDSLLYRKIREECNALLYEYAASNQSDTRTLYVVEGAVRYDGLSKISTNKEVHDKIKLEIC